MDPFTLLAVAGIIGFVLFFSNSPASGLLAGASGDETTVDQNQDAINVNIAGPLGIPAAGAAALYAQAKLETGNFASNAFAATNSLFNRHKGNGAIGVENSDGYWTGRVYYATSADPDLRIYTDIYQSAQDMAQLLQDPLYASALAALRAGSPAEYFTAVTKAGYAASPTYAMDLQSTYDGLA